MVSSNSFPQSGDQDYAEDFRAWLGRSNISDYVEEGMEFTVDYSTPEVTVSGGKAFVTRNEETISAIDETRLVTDIVVHVPESTFSLNSNTVNHIYVNPQFDTNDSAQYTVYSDETNAASDAMKIGEIDTENEVITELNRNPDAEVENFRAYRDLGIPVYDELSEAPGGAGNIIYVTGNGSDTEAVYRHDGSSFTPVRPSAISEIPNVSGITDLTEDVSSNKPSAGTEGRIFFETDTQSILYDDGDTWVTIGENSGNVGADDLGFDPATQNELDSHEDDGDAHHSKTSTLDELNDSDISDIGVDISDNRPDGGTSGRLFLERDTGRVLYDNGSGWIVLGVSSHSELDDVSTDDHHERYTDAETINAVESTTLTLGNTPTLPGATFADSSGSGSQFTITEDSASGDLHIEYDGTSQHSLVDNGDMQITGLFTENASL